MKAKTNRKARRTLGMTHWESNRFKIALTSSTAGQSWAVVKKKK